MPGRVLAPPLMPPQNEVAGDWLDGGKRQGGAEGIDL